MMANKISKLHTPAINEHDSVCDAMQWLKKDPVAWKLRESNQVDGQKDPKEHVLRHQTRCAAVKMSAI